MKINECKQHILSNNYAPIELYLSSLVSIANIENNNEVKENLTYLNQLNIPTLNVKILETLDLLEKLKKFRLIIDVLRDTSLRSVTAAILILKSYYALGYLEDFRSHLVVVIDYIIKNKLWNKSTFVESVVDKELFSIELYELKVRTLHGLGAFEDLIEFISKESSKDHVFKSKTLENILKSDIPEVVSYKISLLLKGSELGLSEKLKKLILFYKSESVIKILNEKKRSKLDFKIIPSKESEEVKLESLTNTRVEIDQEKPEAMTSYKACHEEEKFLTRLKLKDPMFEEYNRDVAISFINLGMYKLVFEYLEQFDLDNDGIYLKLESLNNMGKYSQVIDIVNSKNLDEFLAFRYLKAIAYKQMGVSKLAKAEFMKVAKEDSNFRDVKELIK